RLPQNPTVGTRTRQLSAGGKNAPEYRGGDPPHSVRCNRAKCRCHSSTRGHFADRTSRGEPLAPLETGARTLADRVELRSGEWAAGNPPDRSKIYVANSNYSWELAIGDASALHQPG